MIELFNYFAYKYFFIGNDIIAVSVSATTCKYNENIKNCREILEIFTPINASYRRRWGMETIRHRNPLLIFAFLCHLQMF